MNIALLWIYLLCFCVFLLIVSISLFTSFTWIACYDQDIEFTAWLCACVNYQAQLNSLIIQTWKIFTVRNSSCGKVMFSQTCVKNSVHGEGGCLPKGMLGYTHPPRADTPSRQTPLGQTPPSRWTPPLSRPPGRHPPALWDARIRSTSGRYASYWNAFLFYILLHLLLNLYNLHIDIIFVQLWYTHFWPGNFILQICLRFCTNILMTIMIFNHTGCIQVGTANWVSNLGQS